MASAVFLRLLKRKISASKIENEKRIMINVHIITIVGPMYIHV